jgi:hypothetical protein
MMRSLTTTSPALAQMGETDTLDLPESSANKLSAQVVVNWIKNDTT